MRFKSTLGEGDRGPEAEGGKKLQRVKVKLKKKKKKTHMVVYLTQQLYCIKVAATFPVFGGLTLCLCVSPLLLFSRSDHSHDSALLIFPLLFMTILKT